MSAAMFLPFEAKFCVTPFCVKSAMLLCQTVFVAHKTGAVGRVTLKYSTQKYRKIVLCQRVGMLL
jgi:hypothetical protein